MRDGSAGSAGVREPLFIKSVGAGAPLLLVHGSAADHTTWTIQFASLQSDTRMVAWDRRGLNTSPLPPGVAFFPVEAHADDAAHLIQTHFPGPVVACGSSFGAVVVLELARRHPQLLRGMVLLEPPVRPNEESAVPLGFLSHYDELVKERGGPAASEFFLRAVLGAPQFERMPRPFRERSLALWPQIRQDIAALDAYRVRYAELPRLTTPALLIGGERSAPIFRPTLLALEQALGAARLEILQGAGHMMHAEAHRPFHQKLLAFIAEVG